MLQEAIGEVWTAKLCPVVSQVERCTSHVDFVSDLALTKNVFHLGLGLCIAYEASQGAGPRWLIVNFRFTATHLPNCSYFNVTHSINQAVSKSVSQWNADENENRASQWKIFVFALSRLNGSMRKSKAQKFLEKIEKNSN